MPITVKTVYTKEALLRFSDTLGKRRLFLWVMLAIGTVLVCGFSISTALIIGWNLELVLYILFALLWDAVGIFMTYGLPRLTVGKNPALNDTITYLFYNDRFQIQGENLFFSEMGESRYRVLDSVIKSGDDLYLMFTRQQGCIVDLGSLSRKQISQLHGIFKKHFSGKCLQWKD